MIRKELLATEYTFYRYPSIYLIFLVPLVPSIILIMARYNLYIPETGIFSTTNTVTANIISEYIFFFRLIFSLITGFFIVYRWSLIKQDGAYGYWITQGVDQDKFVLTVIGTFTILVTISEFSGYILIIIYLGLQFTFIEIVSFLIGAIFTNLMLTSVAIVLGDLILRPEIAGLLFVTFSIFNTTLNSNPDSILFLLLKLENNFTAEVFSLAAFLVIFLLSIGLAGFIYFRKFRDVEI